MNKITGEINVNLDGKVYSLRYDWDCIAAIDAEYGEEPNLSDPDTLASIAAIGFKAKHPELTAEKIKELSPPLVPFVFEVRRAIQYAYFGPDDPEKFAAEGVKKNRVVDALKRPIKWLFRKE